ncbi:hypothetical protein CSW58_08820 [Caulobacter sp. B11]|nr:hypothetical protein CSW58_08820 [Caulobacter sp. B11]
MASRAPWISSKAGELIWTSNDGDIRAVWREPQAIIQTAVRTYCPAIFGAERAVVRAFSDAAVEFAAISL